MYRLVHGSTIASLKAATFIVSILLGKSFGKSHSQRGECVTREPGAMRSKKTVYHVSITCVFCPLALRMFASKLASQFLSTQLKITIGNLTHIRYIKYSILECPIFKLSDKFLSFHVYFVTVYF